MPQRGEPTQCRLVFERAFRIQRKYGTSDWWEILHQKVGKERKKRIAASPKKRILGWVKPLCARGGRNGKGGKKWRKKNTGNLPEG